jgi:N-methylhydantoinase A
MVQTLTASLTSIRAEVLEQHFAELIDRGQRELRQEGIEDAAAGRSLDLRYQGQTYTLNIPFTDVPASIADFHAAHRQRYGHDLDRVVELVNLRVNLAATRPQISLPLAAPMTPSAEKEQLDLPGIGHPVRLVARGRLGPGSHIAGPALVTEPHSTTLIKAGWSAESDRAGNLILRRGGVT